MATQKTKCLIVDDEPLAIEVIKDYIEQIPQLEVVATCSDAMKAFDVLNDQQIDLLLLDIEMPGMTGLEFIKSLAFAPHVILTTAHRQYAIESYEVGVVDYLLKPVSFSRFFKAINKYLQLKTEAVVVAPVAPQSPAKSGSIYVYANKKNVKLYFDDIIYLESIKDYVRIHTNSKNVITKNTITSYESLLPNTFVRLHRSYIVNTAKITAFTHHDVEIGDKEIPIGTSYKRVVLERLKA